MLVLIENITDHEEVLEHIGGLTAWVFFPKEIRELDTKQINIQHFWKKIAENKLKVCQREEINRFELMDFE